MDADSISLRKPLGKGPQPYEWFCRARALSRADRALSRADCHARRLPKVLAYVLIGLNCTLQAPSRIEVWNKFSLPCWQ